MPPRDWQERLLGDVVEHQKGFAFKSSAYSPFGHPVIRVSNFTDRSISMTDCIYLDPGDAAEHPDVVIRKDDVVIATVGSWPSNQASVVGRVICVPSSADGALLNQNAVRLRGANGLDQQFLFYLLKAPEFQTYIVGTAQGSANQASITLKDIFGFRPLLPPLSEQRMIARALRALDDKIELNWRTNQTLEAIARAIFKYSFMDVDSSRPRSGWSYSRVGERLSTVLGGTPSRSNPDYWGGDIPWVNSGKVNEFPIFEPTEYITKAGLESSATKMLPARTTVLAITGATLGKVSLLEIESCANQSVVGILGSAELPSEYVFFWVENHIEELIASQTGGAQQHINKNNVNELRILCPSAEVMLDFKRLVGPMLDLIRTNCFENISIGRLRDTLLPKLMSGKMRIPQAARVVENHA